MLASPGLFCHTQSGHPRRARQWRGARHERLAGELSPSWQRPVPDVHAAAVRVGCLPRFSRFILIFEGITGNTGRVFLAQSAMLHGHRSAPVSWAVQSGCLRNITMYRTRGLRFARFVRGIGAFNKGVIHGPIRLIVWRMFYRWHACCRAFNVTTPAAPRRCLNLSPRRRLRLYPRRVGLLTIACDQHELAGEVQNRTIRPERICRTSPPL